MQKLACVPASSCSHYRKIARICVLHQLQVGTAVVTRQDKRLAVGRLGALVEQIEALVSKDLQVILVSCILHPPHANHPVSTSTPILPTCSWALVRLSHAC